MSEVCTSVVLALDDEVDAEPLVIRYTRGDRTLGFEVEHPRALSLGELDAERGAGPSEAELALAVARAVTDSLRIETGALGTRIVASRRLTGRAG